MSNSETPETGTERVTRSSTTARNPRRRARQSDNDSLKTSAPRRKRSKITTETYAPRDGGDAVVKHEEEDAQTFEDGINSLINGHGTSASSHVNGYGTANRHQRAGSTTVLDGELSIPMRAKKGTVKRALRGEGATVLASNQCYNVKLLSSTPKELRKESLEYRGSIVGTHALAVTHHKAYVWEYTQHVANSNLRVFDMPFPSKQGEPLPFGALVLSGVSANDLGMVLVSTTSGKVVFYESVDRAASLGLFHNRRSGVEGDLSISHSEAVNDMVAADHAGFVITLTSGRILQLTLRDAQGRARIASQYLKIMDAGPGGVLGSFTGFLKSNYRRDLTAVHTRALNQRGHMQVVGLTEKAEILLWDLDWSGRYEYKASIELREVLLKELREIAPPELQGQMEYATALDFAITDGPKDVLSTTAAEQPLFLFVLMQVGTPGTNRHYITEIILPGDGELRVERIHDMQTYSGFGPTSTQSRPRLLIPKPGHTAFVAFEDATVMVSMQSVGDPSPEAQLHASYLEPDSFEESVYLRKGFANQSVCEENFGRTQASTLAFVKGAGLVRTSVADVKTLPSGPRISAKSRIEQAVFFGTLQPENVIDFSRKGTSSYDLEEVEDAALAISDEILRANTAFPHIISPSPSSMEQHLATKAKALKALINHVGQSYPTVSRSTRWRLLWDAERLAAGQQLWITFEEHITLVSKEKRKATVLDELCSWFTDSAEPMHFAQRADLADETPVRKFFIGGLHHLEKLLQNARIFLGDFTEDASTGCQDGLKIVVQADDIWLRSLETAFAFRSENCADYGILPELIDDGILVDLAEYTDVPEFWTSGLKLIELTQAVTTLSRELAKKYYEPEELDEEGEQMAHFIAENNTRLVQLYCLQAKESINWRAAHHDLKFQELAQKMQADFEEQRYRQIRRLADVGQADAGMKLAEKYRDMHTLTDMVIAEDQYVEEISREHAADKSSVAQARKELQAKVRRYFDRYQTDWSDAFFDKLFSSGSSGTKLIRAQIEWKKPLTEYLRGHPNRAKLCWINDVTESGDFGHASEALAQCAQQQETKLWSKKVELSMSKLALLAAEEDGDRTSLGKLTNGDNSSISRPGSAQGELAIVKIQEAIYKHLEPDIVAAIDKSAEIDICLQKYANHVADMPALRSLLEHGLNMVLDHNALTIEELIDVLTLMDVEVAEELEHNMQGSEIFFALSALNAAAPSLPASRFETLLALVWKRVYIYDDWAALKQSMKNKSDADRMAMVRKTAVWNTLFHVLDSDLLSPMSGEQPHVRILDPAECLNTACRAEHFGYRFPSEDLLDPILHDAVLQDEILKENVYDRGLDLLAEEAKEDVKAFIHAKAEENARTLAGERLLQERFQEENFRHENGHVIAPAYADGGAEEVDGNVEVE